MFEKFESMSLLCLFYKVALDIVKPLSETKNGNVYALVAINHYSKWCEVRPTKDHDATIATKFLKE
jgi:hypothetical protein